MKIVFALPGHLKTVPMGAYCAEALKDLGHDVTVIDFRSQWHDKLREKLSTSSGEEKPSVNSRIRRLVDAVRPDVFVTLFGFDVSVQTLEHLRQRGIPTACWWINDPFQFQRSAQKGSYYDFLFSNSAGSADAYRELGIKHAYFLPTACQRGVHQHVPAAPEYACEICFAGDWSPLREQLMLKLHDRFDLRIFGPWSKKLASDSPLRQCLVDGFFTPHAMTAMFNSADIVLNLHTWYGKFDHGVNPRLFEAAACGAVQLADHKREIPGLFAEHKEILLYQDLDEVGTIARGILALPAQQRRDIGLAAQKRALNEHTYHHRMASLLDTMGQAGA